MARVQRIRRNGHYHVMSRTNDRRYLFSKGRMKSAIVAELRRAAGFSGVEVRAFCVMDNHFHVVCTVRKPSEPLSEKEVLSRIAILRGETFADALAKHWEYLRHVGCGAAAEEALGRWRGRMHDVSEFMKIFKELVSRLYKRENAYCGSIWSGRFRSVFVEGGTHLATCVRYVELNPVRAGVARRAKDYAWSSANGPECPIDGPSEGPVPAEGELLRRVAQIGCGAVFGSRTFVLDVYGSFFIPRGRSRPDVRQVIGASCSTHGHRLAAKG